jgi:hypothetical protein
MKEKHKPAGMVLVMPFQAQVAIFDSLKARNKYYKKVLKLGNIVHAAVAVASYNQDDDGEFWYSITFQSEPNIGTIIHECSHMVDFMFEIHGVPGGIESTEIRAYMLSLLVLDVCEILNVFGAAQFQ